MKFILSLGNLYRDWEETKKLAAEADRLGFWGVALPDHYLRGEGSDDATLETWVALTHLASITRTVHVGTLVTPIPFRPPAVLAKIVATLDVISNGRTFLGVGAGWSRREFETYSEWNEPKIRVSKTEEGVELMLKLWTEKRVEFQGKYYHSKGGVLEPKPVQRPHPPLLFGGTSPRMLRLAGRLADIVFVTPDIKQGFTEARSMVLEAAQKSGRSTGPSFADSTPPITEGQFGPSKYVANTYKKSAIEAQQRGCDYLLVDFPTQQFYESIKDFSENVLRSFS